jgi:hypothetical protein
MKSIKKYLPIILFTTLITSLSVSNVWNMNPVEKRIPGLGDCAAVGDAENEQCEVNIQEYYLKDDLSFNLGSMNGKTWTLNAEGIETMKIDGVLENFGRFEVQKDGQKIFVVKENNYYLGRDGSEDAAFGIRFLPIYDEADFADNEVTQTLDDYLRSAMGISAEDKLFAPIVYYHPEYFKGDVTKLGQKHRFDDGFTHMGAYIGKRRTRNAPYRYHNKKWEIRKKYPANIYQVSYDGVSQKVFNQNLHTTLRILNETNGTVRFSSLDYEKDFFDGNNLKAIFDFYRAWLDNTWIRSPEDGRPFWDIIKSVYKYDTYCAEHITMVINVALNLVQSEQGYIDLFGKNSMQVGEQQKMDATGSPVYIVDENGADKLKSVPFLDEYGKEVILSTGDKMMIEIKDPQLVSNTKGGEYFYALAKRNWKLHISDEAFKDSENFKTLWQKMQIHKPVEQTKAGYGLAWAPQTLADLVSDFMALYGRFDKVGFAGSVAMIDGFELEVRDRLKSVSNSDDFKKLVAPVKQLLGKYAEKVKAEVASKVEAIQKLMASGYSQEQAQMAVGQMVAQSYYTPFRQEVLPLLEVLRSPEKIKELGIELDQSDEFFYYSPPTVLNRIVQGNHRKNKYVQVRVLGTAVDSSVLEEAEKEGVSLAKNSVESEDDGSTEWEDNPLENWLSRWWN